MKRVALTIAREYGSGGRIIAKKVAENLSIPFYDKELIELAAKETGFTKDFITQTEEKKTTSFLYSLYFNTQQLPLSDQIFLAQSKIIKKIADEGSCVIVGRCADYVLRDHPNCLKVYIHAPLEYRIKRAVKEYGIDEQNAKSIIQKEDKSRASYYNYFSSNKWGVLQNYDMTINSSLGDDATASVIEELLKGRC